MIEAVTFPKPSERFHQEKPQVDLGHCLANDDTVTAEACDAHSLAWMRRCGELMQRLDARGGDRRKKARSCPFWPDAAQDLRAPNQDRVHIALAPRANASFARACLNHARLAIGGSIAVAFEPFEAVGPKPARRLRAGVARRLRLRRFGLGWQARARSVLLVLSGGGQFVGWPGQQHSVMSGRRARDGG